MDVGVLVATAGALGGVVLGSLLSGWTERRALRETHHEARVARREAVYTEVLIAYRTFRRALMTQPFSVRLVTQANGKDYALVDGGAPYWEKIESARARLLLVVGEQDAPWRAAEVLGLAVADMAIARSTHAAGNVPVEVVDALRRAEREFAAAARADLSSG